MATRPGTDLNVMCPCGAGLCHVEPVPINPRFLFVCCPSSLRADGGGCGFMQWRDTVDPTNIFPRNASSPQPPSTPPRTGAGAGAGAGTAQKTCPCGAACFVGTARNGRNFYFCLACTNREWCDAMSSSRCYICRKEGHWYMDCPHRPPSAATNKDICFYCKQAGHYASQCRFKRQRRRY